MLALKIAEIENLRAALGRPPLLLLDDVSSELDPDEEPLPARATSARLPAQAFLTTTDRRLDRARGGPGARLLRGRKAGPCQPLVS